MKLEILKKSILINDVNYQKADTIAQTLLNEWQSTDIDNAIRDAHKVNATSHQIQAILLPAAHSQGFKSEKKGLFNNYRTSGLRPDYYKQISETSGIIMEIERGKTLANNMDMLDVWKCHICREANYLFLVVPIYRPTKEGKETGIFDNVYKRLSSFFHETNYINIDAIFIFGY